MEVAKTKTTIAKTLETIQNNQKKVEYMMAISFLSSLFSTNSLTTELLIPSVATDFNIVEKFLKLPIKAIPEVPRNMEIILEEKMPNTKLTATETEFSDRTLYSLF